MKPYYKYAIAIVFASSLIAYILTGAWGFLITGLIFTVLAFGLRYIAKILVNRSIKEEEKRKREWNNIFDKEAKRFKTM